MANRRWSDGEFPKVSMHSNLSCNTASKDQDRCTRTGNIHGIHCDGDSSWHQDASQVLLGRWLLLCWHPMFAEAHEGNDRRSDNPLRCASCNHVDLDGRSTSGNLHCKPAWCAHLVDWEAEGTHGNGQHRNSHPLAVDLELVVEEWIQA